MYKQQHRIKEEARTKTNDLKIRKPHTKTWISLIVLLVILLTGVVLASQVQQDFGRVNVSNLTYENYNGIPVRAKLLEPVDATSSNPDPNL